MAHEPVGALLVRDILDGQLESVDRRKIGRVADVDAEWDDEGNLRAVELRLGPQALLGRVSPRLRAAAQRVLRGRFEHRIPVREVLEVGPTVRLRGRRTDYPFGRTDEWVAEHVLRFIPGSGRPPSQPLRERL